MQQTTGIEHAQALARGAVQAGDVAVSYGGDGLAGAVAHALRGTPGHARDPPRRARQRLRAQARDPARRRRGVRGARTRRRAHGRRRGGRRPHVPRHRELRDRHRGAGHRERHDAPGRPGGLPLRDAARARRLAAGGAAARDRRRRAAALRRLLRGRVQLRRLRRRHAPRARRRRRRRAHRDRLLRRPAQVALPARPGAGVPWHAPARPRRRARAGARGPRRRRAARSASTPTAIRSAATPATIRAVPRALRVLAP